MIKDLIFLFAVVVAIYLGQSLLTRLTWKAQRVTEAARTYFVAAGAKVDVVKNALGGLKAYFIRVEYAGRVWEIWQPPEGLIVCIRPPDAVRSDPGKGAKPLLGYVATFEDPLSGGDEPVKCVRMWLMRHRDGWKRVAVPSDTPGEPLWRYARGGCEKVVLEFTPEMMDGIGKLVRVTDKDYGGFKISVWPDRIYYIFPTRIDRTRWREPDEVTTATAELIQALTPLAQWRWTEAGWAMRQMGE